MYNGAAAYLISTLGHASFAVIPVRLHCVVNLYVSAFVIFQLLMIVMPPTIQTGRRHIFYLVHPFAMTSRLLSDIFHRHCPVKSSTMITTAWDLPENLSVRGETS